MIIRTHLISGAGNTFHIAFDSPDCNKREVAQNICQATRADGFIFLQQTEAQYKWFFFNNDGSDAEMCGNATRCVGFYIKNILKSGKNNWNLLTIAGPIKIEAISAEEFKIIMTPAQELKSSLGFYCDTGVPHLVIEAPSKALDFSGNKYKSLWLDAKKLRQHAEFSPRGTNVTYVSFEKDTDGKQNWVKAVSYERGVENFTEACGTGAMAAALFNLTKRGANPTWVEMPGGILMMDLSDLNKPTMTGPAVLMGSYEYEV